MNINMLRDQDDNAGFWTAVANSDQAASFVGATLYVSPDGTAAYTKTYSVSSDPNYTQAAIFTVEATIGYATNALGDFHGGNIPDELNTLNVILHDGSLSSTDYAGLISGINTLIVGEEILYFRTATLQADGSYTLTSLLRGRRGSEYAMPLHAVDDRVMFVDLTTFVRIPQVNADIGQPKLFKAVPVLSSIGAVAPESFTNTGAPLKPYAPYHLGGGKEANGDWTLNWVRGGRIDAAWRDYVDVPLGESVEVYAVEIYTDDTFVTLKRTISATSQTATYTSAQQTTDFGGAQTEVYFVVYQVSAAVGPGYSAYGHVVASGTASPVTAPPPPTPAPPPDPAPAPAPSPSPAPAPIPFAMGLNIHEGGASTAENTTIVSILETRGITSVRMDLWETPANQTLVTDIITKLGTAGISIQGILMTDAQNDNTIYTGGALATWEADNNASADVIVDRYFPMGVTDYELLNEVTLRAETVAQVAFNSGQLEAAYTGQTAFISIASALKGMADAVHAKDASCRVILGTVGRDWGFLRYMDTLGVNFDVVGWHNYPSESTASMLTDTYYGTGGPLAQLDAFGLPITINEFHSGEIRLAGYGNVAGDTETEDGYQGLTNHLQDLYSQTVTTRLESVIIYELLDEPAKSAPENHFGLMYGLTTPKTSLFIVTAFAGGTLTAVQRAEITSRGLLPEAEINAMQPPTTGLPYDGGPITVANLPTTFLQTTTGPDGEAYWINDGVWGAGSLTRGTYTGLSGTQYEQYIGVSPDLGINGEIAFRMVWKWPTGTTEVKSYPGAIYGNKPGFYNPWVTPGGNNILLPDGSYSDVYPSGPTPNSIMPLQLPLAPLYSTFNYTHLDTPTGRGHLAYDIWLQDTSEQYQGFGTGITHEIMIPVNYWGDYGAYPFRNASWYSHDTTIDGFLFHVYYAPDFNGVWKFIVFEPDSATAIPPGTQLSLHLYVNHVTAQGWATGNEWCVEPEFGVEPEYGTGDLVVHGYRVFA